LTFAISANGYLNEDQLSGGSTIVPSNGWTHVAVVIGGTDKMYVNGALAGSIVTNLRPSDLGIMDYAFIGRSQFAADPYFDGQIDEFRVYNRALTTAEVQALYQFTGP
jgi:hypothetical protein